MRERRLLGVRITVALGSLSPYPQHPIFHKPLQIQYLSDYAPQYPQIGPPGPVLSIASSPFIPSSSSNTLFHPRTAHRAAGPRGVRQHAPGTSPHDPASTLQQRFSSSSDAPPTRPDSSPVKRSYHAPTVPHVAPSDDLDRTSDPDGQYCRSCRDSPRHLDPRKRLASTRDAGAAAPMSSLSGD